MKEIEPAEGNIKAYVCPMHSEVRENRHGKCPKCGMDLVPVKDAGEGGREGRRNAESRIQDSKAGRHDHNAHHAHMADDFKKRFFISLIATIPVLLLSPMIQQFIGIAGKIRFPGDSYVLFLLSAFVYLYGGFPFLKGLYDELKARTPGMMTLIGFAISVAFIYSSFVVFGLAGKIFFWETVTLIDIMLLGHWIEMKSVMGASRALEELAKLMPHEAHLAAEDGGTKDVPVDTLKTGDKILVKPGEKVPADGKIIKGTSSINESMLTGESRPIDKKEGGKVIGGSVNGEGAITVEVEKTGKGSFISQVIELVKQAQESKSKTQDLANRAAVWLTVVALSAGAITMLVWIPAGKEFVFALERAVTVMIITCPHALGLAIPLVVAVSTSLAAKNGFLIRNRAAFEKARAIQAVIFDKTGTLTEGRFGVTDVINYSGDYTKETVLKYAASIESNSEHPIAKAIVEASKEKDGVENFRAIPGKGAEGRVNGKEVKVVSPGYLRGLSISVPGEAAEVLKGQGKTVVFLLVDGKISAAIALTDIIRKESKEAVAALKSMGIKCIMLTGDNKQAAKWVSDELGLDEFFAEVLPDGKAAKVREVQARGLVTAMTGDGINDAPALATADVGIAIGAGTDVAVETADIILVRSNPMDVVSLIHLAKNTFRKMIQNLVWATGYNVIAIPLAAGVLYNFGILLSPAAGAVLMSLSTVIVAINAGFLKAEKAG